MEAGAGAGLVGDRAAGGAEARSWGREAGGVSKAHAAAAWGGHAVQPAGGDPESVVAGCGCKDHRKGRGARGGRPVCCAVWGELLQFQFAAASEREYESGAEDLCRDGFAGGWLAAREHLISRGLVSGGGGGMGPSAAEDKCSGEGLRGGIGWALLHANRRARAHHVVFGRLLLLQPRRRR